MVAPSLSGFPELLPAQRMVEQEVIDTLARVFQLHGFANIETRAVEPLTELLRKGDTSKEVYVLSRLHDEPSDEVADAASRLGLHFDLTVPFARYVVEHASQLQFPFRRYQIQKVWRGERPQEGRFREFVQADIDIVGRDTLAFHHDVEVARVMVEALRSLEFLPGLTLQLNNRKLIQGFYLGIGVDAGAQLDEVLRLIDKLDKASAAEIQDLLCTEAGLSDDQAQLGLQLASICSADSSFVAQVRELGVEHPLLEEGLAELSQVLHGCASLVDTHIDAGEATAKVRVEVDLKIARGLDYYTGTVFETRMDGYESLGSICSGGRYDTLAQAGKTTYPGVGISLGLSRVLVTLMQRTGLAANRSVPSVVMVAVHDEESRGLSEQVAQALRTRNISAEVSHRGSKYGRQIRAADQRGIPFVWFPAREGQSHQVRDIRSGEQVAADPDQWLPPASDLRPRPQTDAEVNPTSLSTG